MKRPMAIAATVVVVVAALVWFVMARRPAPKPPATAPAIPVATVRMGIVERTLALAGRVGPAAGTQTKLAFSIPGTLRHIDVTLGEGVAQGAALAELNATPLALAAQQAQADAQAARAQEAYAQIDRVSVKLRVDEAELARQRVLFAAGVVAQRDVEAALAIVANDRAGVQGAQEQLALAQAQASSASTRAVAAGYALSLGTLRAPVDGVVVGIYAQAGEVVDVSTPIVAIAPNATNFATLDVPVVDVARIAAGDLVHVRAGGRQFDARIGGIAPAVDPATGLAVVGVTGVPSDIPPGTPMDATVVYGHVRGLVVPQSSLVADPQTGEMIAFVQTSSGNGGIVFTPRHVTASVQSGDLVLVNGLRLGERVAVQGAIDLLAPPSNSGN
ncbi:MAG TPA: efflux RND transporter periplasmic adaptor subunit [Candidatus Tyrphobacter sp.]